MNFLNEKLFSTQNTMQTQMENCFESAYNILNSNTIISTTKKTYDLNTSAHINFITVTRYNFKDLFVVQSGKLVQ